jgi:hypothetical protein
MKGITKVYGHEIFKFTDTTLYAVIPFDKEVMGSVKRGDVQDKAVKESVKKTDDKVFSAIFDRYRQHRFYNFSRQPPASSVG